MPENATADIHGTADQIPLADGCFDTVLCTQVLEHVPEPGLVIMECARVLRPGGVLILTAPQYWEEHEEPHDYYRFTEHGMAYLLERARLQIVARSVQGRGYLPAQALNLAIQHVGECLPFGKTLLCKAAKLPVYFLINVLALIFGFVFGNHRDGMNHLMVARKPTT